MAFYLYRKTSNLDYSIFFSSKRNISLAGLTGPIARLVSQLPSQNTNTLKWSISEIDILNIVAAPCQNNMDYSISIDLKPKVLNELNYYFLKRIHGFS